MRVALPTILLLALLSCEDPSRVTEKKRSEEARAERLAKQKAEDDSERDLMKSPVRAIPELQRRMSDWLTVSDGVATLVVGSTYSWRVHAVPARSSWLVSCNSGGIEIAIVNGASEEALMKQLTRTSLTNDECRPLAAAVGQHMLRLLRAGDMAEAGQRH